MPMTVPTLDHTVFTPGPARDYAAHALQIAREFPDYAKQFREAQAAEMQRQIALQKYQNDALKAQAFLDMYPEYRAAEIAKFRGQAANYQMMADTMPGYRDAQIGMMKAKQRMYSDTTDPALLDPLKPNVKPPPIGGAAATGGAGAAEPTPADAVADPLDANAPSWRLPALPWQQ